MLITACIRNVHLQHTHIMYVSRCIKNKSVFVLAVFRSCEL